MLTRETTKHGCSEIEAEGEFRISAKNDQEIIIPFNSRWDKVLVQLSGGLDSSLMTYLVAKKYAEAGLKTKIQPLSFEVVTKGKTLQTAREMLDQIRKLVPENNILPGIEVHIPEDLCVNPHKNNFMVHTVRQTCRDQQVSFEFNGNTKNPPEAVRKDFPDDQYRQFQRDNCTTVYNSPLSASPLAMIDKESVIFLHQKFELIESVTATAVSCDMELKIIEYQGWNFPCGYCWWCRERMWGFTANGIIDPSQATINGL